MKIAVLVKMVSWGVGAQEPRAERVLNPADEAALDSAIVLAQQEVGSEIVVVSFASDPHELQRRVLSRRGHLDRVGRIIVIPSIDLEDLDAFAVAEILKSLVLKETPDVILAGAKSADTGLGIVPPIISEALSCPHLLAGSDAEVLARPPSITLRDPRGGDEVSANLPVVISTVTGTGRPEFRSLKEILEAKRRPAPTTLAPESVVDSTVLGWRRLRTLQRRVVSAAELQEQDGGDRSSRPSLAGTRGKVLVLVEMEGGVPAPAARAILAELRARGLRDLSIGSVVGADVALGDGDAAPARPWLSAISEWLIAVCPPEESDAVGAWVDSVLEIVRAARPVFVIAAVSPRLEEVLPRVAWRLGTVLVPRCLTLETLQPGAAVVRRLVFDEDGEGLAVEDLEARTMPVFLSMWPPARSLQPLFVTDVRSRGARKKKRPPVTVLRPVASLPAESGTHRPSPWAFRPRPRSGASGVSLWRYQSVASVDPRRARLAAQLPVSAEHHWRRLVSRCRFCDRATDLLGTRRERALHVCSQCGWWCVAQTTTSADFDFGINRWFATQPCLKTLPANDISEPLAELKADLLTLEDDPLHISWQLMEDRVAGLFRAFGYELKQTPRTGDKGIDLYVFDHEAGDEVGVQVKRYSGAIEAEQIRAFVGAIFLRGLTRGLYITTSTYRSGAIQEAEEAERRGQKVMLWDADAFLDRLSVVRGGACLSVDDPAAPYFDYWAGDRELQPVAESGWDDTGAYVGFRGHWELVFAPEGYPVESFVGPVRIGSIISYDPWNPNRVRVIQVKTRLLD